VGGLPRPRSVWAGLDMTIIVTRYDKTVKSSRFLTGYYGAAFIIPDAAGD